MILGAGLDTLAQRESALAHESGLRRVEHISGKSLTQRYFADRTDDPGTASTEEVLVATV